MSEYVYKKCEENRSHVINLLHTYKKIHAAAQILVAIPNPQDICLVSSTVWGQRAAFKFAQMTGAYAINKRFTPGTFTNQICKGFKEPSILIVCDPALDKQAIKEASAVNIPVIALCDLDSPLSNVDLVIPCNNKNKLSVAAIIYTLCQKLLYMRKQPDLTELGVPVDVFIYKNDDELKRLTLNDEKIRDEEARKAAKIAEEKAKPVTLLSAVEQGEPSPVEPVSVEVTPEPLTSAVSYEALGASLQPEPELKSEPQSSGPASMANYYAQYGAYYPPHLFMQPPGVQSLQQQSMSINAQNIIPPGRVAAGAREGYPFQMPYGQPPYSPGFMYTPQNYTQMPLRQTSDVEGLPQSIPQQTMPPGFMYPYPYPPYHMPPGYMGYIENTTQTPPRGAPTPGAPDGQNERKQ